MTIPTLDRLHVDHQHYEGLLCLLERQLHDAHCGDIPDYALLRDILDYMQRHADRCHHPYEETLFTRLALRCPEVGDILALLSEQHRRLATYAEELYATFRMRAEETPATELDQATDNLAQAYAELYRAHLHYEESRLYALLTQWLTVEDWRELAAQAKALNSDTEVQVFQALRERIVTDHRALWQGIEEHALYCPLCSAS